jgi:lipopolysaccharide transport system ATP-binding protein
VRICNEAGRETSVFDFGQRGCMRIAYQAARRIDQPDFRFGFARADETHCATFSSMADGFDIPFVEGEGEIELVTPPLSLVADAYSLRLVIRERGGEIVAAQDGGRFHVRHPEFTSVAFGVFHEPAEWRVSPLSAPDRAAAPAPE